jgi:DNA polymerase-3 subunit epsilon
MTAKLWMTMLEDISLIITTEDIPFTLIQKLAKTPKAGVNKLLQSQSLIGGI